MGEVVVEDLVKVYRDGVEAVKGVSFSASRGITMLMGPNGSGKTTTLSMIAGSLKPTRGKVYVMGFDVWGDGWVEARKRIGFAPQDMPFRAKLTVLENLVWYGLIRGMGLGVARRRASELLREVGLYEHRRKRVEELSGGMRRRLTIAAALIGDPEVLILDEPTSGLDPGARRGFWELVERLARDKVVIASTHIAEEAEKHADKVIIFHRGRIVAEGRPDELIERHAPLARIVVKGDLRAPVEVEGATLLSSSPEEQAYTTRSPETVLPRLIEKLIEGGSRIESVEVRKPGLEEVYLRLTGERLEG
ncbi:MAG: ABC transporter ATP-binding protein [Desulfurococcales archaeon]|nr:ABC transporter ATP-binding protein [Desulfurococcales archaeon]